NLTYKRSDHGFDLRARQPKHCPVSRRDLSSRDTHATIEPNGQRSIALGLAHLTRLQDLRFLNIQRTNINDAGLEFAGRITQLKMLLLDDNPITDEGLRHLQRLENLISISLQRNKGITDAGLQYLSGLKN